MAGFPMEKIKPVLVLSGILAFLLILLLVTGGADKEEERQVDSLVSFESDDITALRIEAGKRPVRKFSRTEVGWIMEDPLYSLASGETMQSVIETVDKLVGVPIEIDTSLPMSDFGLQGDELITVTAVNRDGREESFSLGRQIPLDVGYVYTYVPASGKFYKAYKDAREVFTLPLEEYRKKSLLDISISSIEGIRLSGTLTGDTNPVVVEKKPPWWEITAPEAVPGNNGKVKSLLEGILSLRASDFPESYENAIQKDPEFRIEFITSDGSTKALSFFGPYGDDLQYVKSDSIPYALGIPRGVVNNLPLSFDQLRSKAALRFDPDAVQQIRIATESEDFELRKDKGSWYIAAEQNLPAEDAAVRQLINFLTLTDVETLPEARGIEKDDTTMQLRILLTEASGKEHWVELAATKKGSVVPGFSSFREKPFAVPADFFEGFEIDADYFEDKHLLAFESRNIGSVEIQGGSKKIILEKSGSDWLLTEPERAAADSPKSWGLVFALEKLVFEQKISAELFDDTGLSQQDPDFMITIFDSTGEEQGSLDLWINERNNQVYAASNSRNGLFLIDGEILDQIPEDHTELIFRR